MTMFSFDSYNQSEVPNFSLLNPDGTYLYNLGSIYDRSFKLRYNTLSELNFTAPSYINGIAVDYYNYLKKPRIVEVENIGRFVIINVEVRNDGIIEYKDVQCQSYESSLFYKKISLFDGYYYFYNPSNTDISLMDQIISYIPGWTIGTIDADLYGLVRNFEVVDKTIYDFLTNEVSQTFQCVFIFDTFAKTISAKTIANASTSTDIFISFDNLMQGMTIKESSDEIVTALTVLGGENLSINRVNPLGTDIIYDFSYYKTTEWMTQDLINAIDAWESEVAYWQPTYANLLTDLLENNEILLSLESELVDLQSELTSLRGVRDVRIQQGIDTSDIDAQISDVNSLIITKNGDIDNANALIATINASLTGINDSLSFENNFTSQQIIDLNNFIIGNTYTNTNFIQTSIMSQYEIQQQSQELYDQARGIWDSVTGTYIGGILGKISQPRYTFEIDSINFLFLKDFEPFINQFVLGGEVTIELSDDNYVEAVILGVEFNYDDPSSFKMILSNRMRLDDEEFQYSDLYGSIADASTSTNFNSQKWNNASGGYDSIANSKIVSSSTYSSASNICLFSDGTGTVIGDGDAMYVSPTEWTPALVSSGATFSYDEQIGYYAIIGRSCFFQASISTTGVSGTTSNPVYLTLPALSKNETLLKASFTPYFGNIVLTAGYSGLNFVLSPNSASAILYQCGSAGGLFTTLAASELDAATFIVSGNYVIN